MENEKLLSLFDVSSSKLVRLFLLFHNFNRFLASLTNKFDWQVLSGIGNSPLAKLSILVPIVGFAVLYNEKLTEFATLQSNPALCLPEFLRELLSVRLDALYIGLVLFGLASGLYALAAPRVVKKYPDSMSFSRDVVMDPVGHTYVSVLNSMIRWMNDDFLFLRMAWNHASSTPTHDQLKLIDYIDRKSTGFLVSKSVSSQCASALIAVMKRVSADNGIPTRLRTKMTRNLEIMPKVSMLRKRPFWELLNESMQNLCYKGYSFYWLNHLGDSGQDILRAYYRTSARSRPFFRTIVLSFWLLGFAFAFAPTMLTVLFVFAKFFYAAGTVCL